MKIFLIIACMALLASTVARSAYGEPRQWLLIVPIACTEPSLPPEYRDCTGPCRCGGGPNDPYKYWLVAHEYDSERECKVGEKALHQKFYKLVARTKDMDPYEQMQVAQTADFTHKAMDALAKCVTNEEMSSAAPPIAPGN